MEKKQCKGKKPCQQLPSYCDGATRSCCNHHYAIKRSSVVDEESEGVDPENGAPCQETDSIQHCKEENWSHYHHCESYGDDAVSQDKRLRQPCDEREYENDNGETVVYPALYLEDCPGLDVREFNTDFLEFLYTKYMDYHSSSVSNTEVAEPEAFIDIHSREHRNDLNENEVDYISCGNSSFHSESSIGLSPENDVDILLTSFSLLVIGHSSSGASSLIGSLQHNIIVQSDNEWINHDVRMSDSGQSVSDISFSSSELSDGTYDKMMTEDIRFDSGLPMNTSLHSSTQSADYNLKEQEIKVNLDLLQTDPENQRKMLYDFDDKLMKKQEDISFESEFLIDIILLSSTHSVNSASKDQEDEQNLGLLGEVEQNPELLLRVSEIKRKMTYGFDNDNSDTYNQLCQFEHNSKERKRRNHEHLVTDTSHENSILTTEDTVSSISPLDSGISYIMFYIIHKKSSQKIITFHTLEVKKDYQQKTFCRLKSFGLPRGLWLINHLERLGLLTFHQITPTVLIVEPALHGLGGYFQQMAQGQRVTVMDSMQYEWMRVRSFWSFPRNAGVSYLQLARLGFYYTGRVSETCCYSCGRIYREWKEGDDPVEIHRRLSPNCPHLNGQEVRNRPIYPDINQQWPAIPWDPFGDPGEGPREGEGRPDLAGAESSNRDTEQTSVEDNRSQPRGAEVNVPVETTHDLPSLEANPLSNIAQPRPQHEPEIGQQDLSQVETNPAVLDSTPHIVPEAQTTMDLSGSGSVSSEGTSSRQSGGSDRPAHHQDPPAANPGPQQQDAYRPDQSLPRGVPRTDPRTQYMPRYPLYAGQEHRAESFRNGWPAYLNQTPHEMASAGFYYAGNGDYCRCYHCGGGLRNWEPGDDPWVEHARWFPNCLFVRQNKGERFVRLVQQRQQNNRQNEPPRQEPVLQLPPANQPPTPPVEGNRLQGQATPQSNQQSQQARSLSPTDQQSPGQGGAAAAAAARQSAKEKTEAPVDEMSLAAVESLKVNGISSSRIHQALQIWKKKRKKEYKITDITSSDLMQIIFDIEDEENRRFTEASSQFASALSLTSGDPVRGERSDGAGAQFSGTTSEAPSTDPEMAELVALQNEIEERTKKLMCSVCGENEVTVAFIPCGHLVVCYQCAPAMITCPNCREPVKGSVKVFLM